MGRVSVFVCNMREYPGKHAAFMDAVRAYCAEQDRETPQPALWEIRKTPAGKPFFPFQADQYLSISDSGKLRAFALCGIPVGIDLQRMALRGSPEKPRREYCLSLARRWFHPEEYDWVAGTHEPGGRLHPCAGRLRFPEAGQAEQEENTLLRFFLIWTGKEAYVKYTGTGIDADFTRFSVLDPEFPACFFWTPIREKGERGEETLLCICTEKETETKIRKMP